MCINKCTKMFRLLLLFICFIKISRQGSTSFVNNESFRTLSRSKRESENHCVLPNHPANGEIKLLGEEEESYLPNSSVVANTIIDLSCRGNTVTETGGLSRAICYQGKWKPSISQMGGCVRRCPPVQTKEENLSLICRHKNPKFNCSNPIEGTVIQVVCKPFYEYVGLQPTIVCRDGTWDSVISSCQPECGKKRVSVDPLIIGGSTIVNSEYPWVAGIYKSYTKQFLGGATVISRYFVLSAAHIFTSTDGVLLDKSNYIVTAGKCNRDFGDKRDINMQSSGIKRLSIPESYAGLVQNFLGDLAILTLEDPFIFTEFVQPVCVDWTNVFESYDLKEGNKGVITGWGYVQSSGISADELQKLDVPYKSKGTCSFSQDFKKKFFTYDKFCAGYDGNNTSACAGDSGGGIFFENPDSKFFIRGILSVAPRSSAGCDTNTPALYTKISTYLREIKKETERIV